MEEAEEAEEAVANMAVATPAGSGLSSVFDIIFSNPISYKDISWTLLP
jgi:hypothetical protein